MKRSIHQTIELLYQEVLELRERVNELHSLPKRYRPSSQAAKPVLGVARKPPSTWCPPHRRPSWRDWHPPLVWLPRYDFNNHLDLVK